jgi:hypothetical protein
MSNVVGETIARECVIVEISPDVMSATLVLNRFYRNGWRVVATLHFAEARPNQVILERALPAPPPCRGHAIE